MSLLISLASCSPGTGGRDESFSSRGRAVPPVAFEQVAGLPPGKTTQLKSAMTIAGGQRDIGIVDGDSGSGSFSLAGRFEPVVESAGVRILYLWELRDPSGVLVHTVEGEENAGLPAGSDPWTVVTPSVLDRIAKSSTQSMANRLSQIGYATRLSKLYVPPAEYFAMAGPDAHREIDFETLNGPGMAYAGVDMIAPAPDLAHVGESVDPVPGESQMTEDTSAPSAEPVPEPLPETGVAETEPPAAKRKQAEGKVEIRAVAVMPVKGAPGGGDAELTAAMRKTLSAAGWPVVTKPQPDALRIVGHVNIAKQGAEQNVSVRWEVQSPDGKHLGDVKQANRVPSGALDRGWGQAAYAVAEGAAMGIFDIVNRIQ